MTWSPAPRPVTSSVTVFGTEVGWDAAIVVPAKDEARRIEPCLDAIVQAIEQTGLMKIGIVIVVNNTTDTTPQRITKWARAHAATPLILMDCTLAATEAGAGSARRLGLDLAADAVKQDGILLTTDADTRVRPDWVSANLSELAEVDVVCGTVLIDPDEVHTLPPEIGAHGSGEWDYLNASMQAAALLDPLPHDPAPAHRNAAGASLSFLRRVYLAVGGLPALPMGEDRAFAALAIAKDFRLRFSSRAIVETSCRMTGRTEGGMAGALRARATETDPLADEWLEPARTCILRNTLRGRLRAAWRCPAALHKVLQECLGSPEAQRIMSAQLSAHFGEFFAAIEDSSPDLARVRLRQSGCRAELPLLRACLADLDDGRDFSRLSRVSAR